MSGADLRVAVAGFGLAGEVFHAPLIAATPGMRVAAVTTSNAARAARAREAYEGVEVHPDADALLRDVDDLDLLVVATPNRSHVPVARAALARADPGRHGQAACRRRARPRPRWWTTSPPPGCRSRSFRTAAGTATS